MLVHSPALPAWQLYGEQQAPQHGEPWHLETISARSRLHDWEIRPHRHESFQQFLHIASGQAEVALDGAHHPVNGPCVVLVPPMAVHGFRFHPLVQGHVLTVQQRHVHRLLAAVGAAGLASALAVPVCLSLRRHAEAARRLHGGMLNLAEEYAGHAPWRAAALDAVLLQWVLTVARTMPVHDAPAHPVDMRRAALHLERYRALVNARFRLQPRVSDLAAELGLTTTQLNRVCRATLGQPALALLHARGVLEAQRLLAYTHHSVKQVALELGFADPAYFSRFFQRHCGLGPQAWRQQALQRSQPPAVP